MTQGASAGWLPDPTGRFDHRYWDGAQWTEHVSRSGQAAIDAFDASPPPVPPAVPAPPGPPASPGPVAYPSQPSQAPVYGAPVQATVAGLAIASMVLGILWIYWIGSVLAIIFGHIALSQIKKSNGWKTGRGMAIAGVTLGYVGLATFIIFVIVLATASTRTSRLRIDTDPSNGVCNTSRFLTDPDC